MYNNFNIVSTTINYYLIFEKLLFILTYTPVLNNANQLVAGH